MTENAKMPQTSAKSIWNLASKLMKVLEEETGSEVDDPAKIASLKVTTSLYREKIDREASLVAVQLMLNRLRK